MVPEYTKIQRIKKNSLYVMLVLIAVIALARSNGVYISLKEGERRCFIEEVPAHTLIRSTFHSSPLSNLAFMGNSENELQAGEAIDEVEKEHGKEKASRFNDHDFGIRVSVYYPESILLYTEDLNKEGEFTFTSVDSGDYKTTTSAGWFSDFQFKFQFALDTGADAVDYKNVAKKEHLTNLQIESTKNQVRRLIDRSKGILGELQYQKERELAFRETSESTAARTTWFSVLQLGIIVVSGVLQMQYLKRFFHRRKMI